MEEIPAVSERLVAASSPARGWAQGTDRWWLRPKPEGERQESQPEAKKVKATAQRGAQAGARGPQSKEGKRQEPERVRQEAGA